MQHCSICDSGTKLYKAPEEIRNVDCKRLRALKSKENVSAQSVWLEGALSRDRLWECKYIPQAGTLTHTWEQRTTSMGQWKFHPPYCFHHLEDNTASKVFPKCFLCTPSRSPYSWGSAELGDQLSSSRSWVLLLLPTRILLTITLFFKCSSTAPFPIQLVILQCQLLHNVTG